MNFTYRVKPRVLGGVGALGFVTLLMSYSNNNGLITSIDLQTDLSVTEGSTVY